MPSNNLMKLKLFPEDMIDEILVRLPPKSVFRFRCLSRSHCSKFDGREFIKQHLNYSLKSDPYETLSISRDGQVQLFEHRLVTPKVRRLTLPFNPAGHPKCHSEVCPKVRLCGSCHGLIALRICCGDLVVWNPYTNKHKRLPRPESEYPLLMALGFGYDSLTHDYKLVWIDSVPDTERPSEFKVMVYSFKANTWSRVSGLAFPFLLLSSVRDGDGGALFREVLHFRSLKLDTGEECVVAFNLRTEEFRELAGLPDAGRFRDVRVLRGHLCAVFSISEIREMEVWAMTDYGGKDESWTKLLRVSLWPLTLYQERLLDYLDKGRKLVVHRAEGGPVLVDLERWTTEGELRIPFLVQLQTSCSRWLDATLMAGTLVSVDATN